MKIRGWHDDALFLERQRNASLHLMMLIPPFPPFDCKSINQSINNTCTVAILLESIDKLDINILQRKLPTRVSKTKI